MYTSSPCQQADVAKLPKAPNCAQLKSGLHLTVGADPGEPCGAGEEGGHGFGLAEEARRGEASVGKVCCCWLMWFVCADLMCAGVGRRRTTLADKTTAKSKIASD